MGDMDCIRPTDQFKCLTIPCSGLYVPCISSGDWPLGVQQFWGCSIPCCNPK